jgi:cytochrome c peroxidase
MATDHVHEHYDLPQEIPLDLTAVQLPSLGGVEGIFSDLLLHDLSQGDGARTRTPPLWGVRDSAPYLHDGRAPTLNAAIMAHLGEAAAAREAYDKLQHLDKLAVTTFLESLVAPGS